VADGADNPVVREQLTDAVVTLMNVPPHKVRVLPRQGT
jgi:stage III sporulation protein AG